MAIGAGGALVTGLAARSAADAGVARPSAASAAGTNQNLFIRYLQPRRSWSAPSRSQKSSIPSWSLA